MNEKERKREGDGANEGKGKGRERRILSASERTNERPSTIQIADYAPGFYVPSNWAALALLGKIDRSHDRPSLTPNALRARQGSGRILRGEVYRYRRWPSRRTHNAVSPGFICDAVKLIASKQRHDSRALVVPFPAVALSRISYLLLHLRRGVSTTQLE